MSKMLVMKETTTKTLKIFCSECSITKSVHYITALSTTGQFLKMHHLSDTQLSLMSPLTYKTATLLTYIFNAKANLRVLKKFALVLKLESIRCFTTIIPSLVFRTGSKILFTGKKSKNQPQN